MKKLFGITQSSEAAGETTEAQRSCSIGQSTECKEDLVESMGSMPLFATLLAFLLCLLLLAYFLARKYEKVNNAYLALKKKLLYNSLLRYVL